MKAEVILTDLSNNEINRAFIDGFDNKDNLEYEDGNGNKCKLSIFDDGLVLNEICDDHSLELNLRKSLSLAKIVSAYGEMQIDVKVVDFLKKNDILVMRYIVNEQEREIRVIYRS